MFQGKKAEHLPSPPFIPFQHLHFLRELWTLCIFHCSLVNPFLSPPVFLKLLLKLSVAFTLKILFFLSLLLNSSHADLILEHHAVLFSSGLAVCWSCGEVQGCALHPFHLVCLSLRNVSTAARIRILPLTLKPQCWPQELCIHLLLNISNPESLLPHLYRPAFLSCLHSHQHFSVV